MTAILRVNGKPRELNGAENLGKLLSQLDIVPERVVVEHNGTLFKRGEGLETQLAEGDVIEIVQFVGGG